MGRRDIEYVRKLDRAALEASTDRYVQRLLAADSGARTLSFAVIKTPAGGGSPEGLHTHAVDQIFYVLSGTMSIEVQGRREDVGPGSLVVFPAGVAHRNWNDGSEPTVHIAIASPLPDPAVPFATRVSA
ncbi:MAG TPA: cupin domain-containing protein [Candidatus Limnocylindria bacterium]|nr:cupin domain-containing protein [Candidatus Limnocylindria bacterium]